jgi:ankyrin repeat protein
MSMELRRILNSDVYSAMNKFLAEIFFEDAKRANDFDGYSQQQVLLNFLKQVEKDDVRRLIKLLNSSSLLPGANVFSDLEIWAKERNAGDLLLFLNFFEDRVEEYQRQDVDKICHVKLDQILGANIVEAVDRRSQLVRSRSERRLSSRPYESEQGVLGFLMQLKYVSPDNFYFLIDRGGLLFKGSVLSNLKVWAQEKGDRRLLSFLYAPEHGEGVPLEVTITALERSLEQVRLSEIFNESVYVAISLLEKTYLQEYDSLGDAVILFFKALRQNLSHDVFLGLLNQPASKCAGNVLQNLMLWAQLNGEGRLLSYLALAEQHVINDENFLNTQFMRFVQRIELRQILNVNVYKGIEKKSALSQGEKVLVFLKHLKKNDPTTFLRILGVPANFQTHDVLQALSLWAMANNEKSLLSFLHKSEHIENKLDHFSETALMRAIRCNDLHEVKRLLCKQGTNVHRLARNGDTCLHLAAFTGNLKMVKTFLPYFSNVNIKNDFGKTPLHFAAEIGISAVIKLLLDFGADPALSDQDGNRPIDAAVQARMLPMPMLSGPVPGWGDRYYFLRDGKMLRSEFRMRTESKGEEAQVQEGPVLPRVFQLLSRSTSAPVGKRIAERTELLIRHGLFSVPEGAAIRCGGPIFGENEIDPPALLERSVSMPVKVG